MPRKPRSVSSPEIRVAAMTQATNAEIRGIPGWFDPPDTDLFRFLLAESAMTPGGDLAEFGVYLGRSAIVLGSSLTGGERFTVVDTFGSDLEDPANQRENDNQYPSLSRRQFEENYWAVHGSLPTVVHGPSSVITAHASPGTHRFVHIDASHLHEHVVTDLESARILLKPDGIVVLDDYRSPHTPGVAAAAWQAVSDGLRPFALTSSKMYATWGDADRWFGDVKTWVTETAGPSYSSEVQRIGTRDVLRVWNRSARANKYVPPILLPRLSRLRDRLFRSS